MHSDPHARARGRGGPADITHDPFFQTAPPHMQAELLQLLHERKIAEARLQDLGGPPRTPPLVMAQKWVHDRSLVSMLATCIPSLEFSPHEVLLAFYWNSKRNTSKELFADEMMQSAWVMDCLLLTT